MRVKQKTFLGMQIPERELSREELQDLTEEDLEALGMETRFWPWARLPHLSQVQLSRNHSMS